MIRSIQGHFTANNRTLIFQNGWKVTFIHFFGGRINFTNGIHSSAMRYWVTFFFLTTVLFVSAQGHRIEIQVEGLELDTAIVGYHFGSQKYAHDTVVFNKEGKFLLTGADELPSGIYFIFKKGFYIEFIVADQQFGIQTETSKGYSDMKIQNSKENELFRHFQLRMGGFQKRSGSISERLKTASSQDSVALLQHQRDLALQVKTFQDSLIRENENAYVAKVVTMLRNMSGRPVTSEEELKALRGNYLEFVENPKDLMRTPTLIAYVSSYFSNIVAPLPDSINQEIDRWLDLCRQDQPTFDYWLQKFLKDYQEPEIMGFDAVWIHLIERYCLTGEAHWLDDKVKKQLATEVRFIKPNLIGNAAPSFHALDTAQLPFDWRNLKANYLILFFYDPDCGHCKKRVPELNKYYPEIKKLGGEIVGVCVTSDVDKWKQFIRDQKLEWVHLADPRGQSDFRVNYNTRTTPQIYLLSPERTIIAKGIYEAQLIDFLKWYIEHH